MSKIGGPVLKKEEPVAEEPMAETPMEEEMPQEEIPEENVQPQEETVPVTPPMDAEEFYALPPKQAYQAYIDMKNAKDSLENEGTSKIDEAVNALREELESKHQSNIEEIKQSIKSALYGD